MYYKNYCYLLVIYFVWYTLFTILKFSEHNTIFCSCKNYEKYEVESCSVNFQIVGGNFYTVEVLLFIARIFSHFGLICFPLLCRVIYVRNCGNNDVKHLKSFISEMSQGIISNFNRQYVHFNFISLFNEKSSCICVSISYLYTIVYNLIFLRKIIFLYVISLKALSKY